MKFETLGNKENSAILCIHGMFCNGASAKHFAKYLQEEYFVILPTLTGHYEGSRDYISKEEEARQMLAYLHEIGVQKLALLQGTSMGAEIALELARIADLQIEHYFFDGGPFFDFPKWFKAVMRRKFQGFAKLCKGKSGDEAFNDLMKNAFVRKLLGKNKESYRLMLADFAVVCSSVTDKTVKNVTETCYACKLPDFSQELQKRFVFFFSEKEPAHMSKKRLQKKYPAAVFRDMPDMGHCGFQISKPQEYAECLREVMQGE